jgi:hypothetical protein
MNQKGPKEVYAERDEPSPWPIEARMDNLGHGEMPFILGTELIESGYQADGLSTN